MIKDADIGVANSNRDAGIKEAECLKAAMDAKFETDTKIEDDTRAYKLQVAEFEKEVNTAKAQAQLAYQLEAAKLNQKIKSEEVKIDVVVRKKEIEIEEQEILRKEKELKGTVKLPAEAEAFKYVQISEISEFQNFSISEFQNFRISEFQNFRISEFQNFRILESENFRIGNRNIRYQFY